jgi:hypothetical protein
MICSLFWIWFLPMRTLRLFGVPGAVLTLTLTDNDKLSNDLNQAWLPCFRRLVGDARGW